MRGGDRTGLIPRPPKITDETRRSAAVTVCGHAVSKAEARLLLDMCGLLRPAGHTGDVMSGSPWLSSPVRKLP